MKKFLITASLFLAGFITYAQDDLINFGIKGGVNYQTVQIRDFDENQIEAIESGESRAGFHAGVYGRFNFALLFIQPELVYTFQNGAVSYTNSGEDGDLDIRYSRFDVPILIGIKAGPLRIGAGPVATFAISEPGDAFDESLNNATFGYQAGVGVDISKLSIDLRYEGPLSNTANSVEIGGTPYTTDVRSSQVILSLGLSLF